MVNVFEQLVQQVLESPSLVDFIVARDEPALRKAMRRDGFGVQSGEVYLDSGGATWAAQAGRKIGATDETLQIYAVSSDDYGTVYRLTQQGAEIRPKTLPVAPVSQRDPRWAGHSIGQRRTRSGWRDESIGTWFCLGVCYTILANHWRLDGRNNWTPPEMHERLISCGKMARGRAPMGGMALTAAFPEQVKDSGYDASASQRMVLKIIDYLERGVPVIARVDFYPQTRDHEQHWVVLIGRTDDDWWMIDPWTGEIGLVSAHYDIAGSDVLEALFFEPIKPATVSAETAPLVMDVSKWQRVEDIPYASLRDLGVRGVLVRAGGGHVDELLDPRFDHHVSAAKAAGLAVGAYWYVHPHADPSEQAALFQQQLAKFHWEMPFMWDVEGNINGVGSHPLEMPSVALIQAFMRELEGRIGLRRNLCYSTARLLNWIMADPAFDERLWSRWTPDLMLAAYYADASIRPIQPNWWRKWDEPHTLHQYTKEFELPTGIEVDMSRFNGNSAEFAAWLAE